MMKLVLFLNFSNPKKTMIHTELDRDEYVYATERWLMEDTKKFDESSFHDWKIEADVPSATQC